MLIQTPLSCYCVGKWGCANLNHKHQGTLTQLRVHYHTHLPGLHTWVMFPLTQFRAFTVSGACPWPRFAFMARWMQALGISQVLQRPLEPVTGIPLPPAHRETAQVRGTEARKESRGQTGTKQDLARAPGLFLSVCLPCLNLQTALSVTVRFSWCYRSFSFL